MNSTTSASRVVASERPTANLGRDRVVLRGVGTAAHRVAEMTLEGQVARATGIPDQRNRLLGGADHRARDDHLDRAGVSGGAARLFVACVEIPGEPVEQLAGANQRT